MNYKSLAEELLEEMRRFNKMKYQKRITESLNGETGALHYINHFKTAVLPSEICDAMNVSSARIAQTLNSMEEKGLIERNMDTHDRRKILVSLTTKGKDMAAQHQQIVTEALIGILTQLGEEDSVQFVHTMRRIAEIVQEKHSCN